MREPRTDIVDITPELATEYLEMNTHNRQLRPKKVAEFSAAMLRTDDHGTPEWKFNGDTIVFALDDDDEWYLLDGAHRLSAIVESGTTVRSIVVFGADAGAQETIDTGTKRTLADMLRLRGEVDTANLAAALRMVYRYLARQDLRADMVSETAQQLIHTLNEHPGLRDSIRASSRHDSTLPDCPRSVTATLHYLCGGVDELDRDEFFRRTGLGENLTEGDPAWLLRRRFHSNKINTTTRRMQSIELAAMAIKAWNAFREGRDLRILKWNPGGSRPEPFPLIDGFHDAWGDAEIANEPVAA